jgi:hypothetical protein
MALSKRRRPKRSNAERGRCGLFVLAAMLAVGATAGTVRIRAAIGHLIRSSSRGSRIREYGVLTRHSCALT